MSGVSSVYIQDQSNTLKGSIRWYQEEPSGEEIPTLTMQKFIRAGSFSTIEEVSYLDRKWALKVPRAKEHNRFIQREVDILGPLNQREQETGQEHFVQVIAFVILEDKPMILKTAVKDGF